MTDTDTTGDLTVPQRPVEPLVAHLVEVSGVGVDGPLLLRALTHRS